MNYLEILTYWPANDWRRAPVSTLYRLAVRSQLEETHSSSLSHWHPLTTPWWPDKAMMGTLMVLTMADLESLRFPMASVSSDSESGDSSLEPPPKACDNLSGTTAAFQMWAVPSPLAVKAKSCVGWNAIEFTEPV